MQGKPLNILLIEDNPGDARIIKEILSKEYSEQYTLKYVDRLKESMQVIAKGTCDVVLLDLGLPDSQGVDGIHKLHARFPSIPVVVLTGMDDKETAVEAMQAGAQDYLVKGNLNSDILWRVLRYAIERKNFERVEAEAKAIALRVQELGEEHFKLNKIGKTATVPVADRIFGIAPLKHSLKAVFIKLAKQYEDILDNTLEQRTYKVEYDIDEKLNDLAVQLGFLKAGPRDVIEIHTFTMDKKNALESGKKLQAYMRESRINLIKLMGYLVSYYRNYATSRQYTGQKRSK